MEKENFSVKIADVGKKKTVQLIGVIDEDAKFDAITKLSGPLTINFKQVTSINSCGTRNWVHFMKQLSGLEIYFEECTPLVVRQLNMIPSFVGGARVVSVYVPYICADCDQEKLVLVKHQDFQNQQKLEEPFTCEFCNKGQMEFDGQPQKYFAFVK